MYATAFRISAEIKRALRLQRFADGALAYGQRSGGGSSGETGALSRVAVVPHHAVTGAFRPCAGHVLPEVVLVRIEEQLREGGVAVVQFKNGKSVHDYFMVTYKDGSSEKRNLSELKQFM